MYNITSYIVTIHHLNNKVIEILIKISVSVENTSPLFTLKSKSPVYLSFGHVEPYSMQGPCHTYKNLPYMYDLAHYKSSIQVAQWLQHPTSILEAHGFKSLWGLGKFFF